MGRFVIPERHSRPVWFAAMACLLLLLSASAVAWRHYFMPPPVDLAFLPVDLIPLESPLGKKLLAESDARADYPDLAANFVTQSRRAYCGVASSVIVLNALQDDRPPLDQATYFDSSGRVASFDVSLTGMSMRELADGLRAHGMQVEPVHASETDIDAFRTAAIHNLRTPGDYLLVSYQRAALGQVESGHISPVAAFHSATDRLLVMDVAAYKYPPVWVPVDRLWEAMRRPLNAETQTTRGFVEVWGAPREAVAVD